MASVNKVDLSLDEIIKLSKKGRGRGRGGTRGRGRGGGATQGSGGVTRGTRRSNKARGGQSGASTVARLRATSQARAQQLRQKARQTLQQKKRSGATQETSGLKSQQPVTNVKQRLGTVPNQQRGRGRGARGRGVVAITTGKGRGQTSTRGGKIKILRGAKNTGGVRGRRGRGGRYNVTAIRNQLKQAADNQQSSSVTRGRGRGRGRGHGQMVRQLQVEIQPAEYEPAGVDLHPLFAADQHTTRSLNVRFTPKAANKSSPRFVQGGRSVNYDL